MTTILTIIFVLILWVFVSKHSEDPDSIVRCDNGKRYRRRDVMFRSPNRRRPKPGAKPVD